jgi:hypothetical protein
MSPPARVATPPRRDADRWRKAPALLIPLALASLVGGLWAGLARMGWPLRFAVPDLLHAHGALMVAGFLGTVIGIERAVALGARWAFAAPLLTGASSLVLIASPYTLEAGHGIAAGSGVFLVASLLIFLRQRAVFTAVMLLGALCWLLGNVLWLSPRPVFQIVHGWTAFLVLTIAAERLELTRLTPRGRGVLGAFVVLVLVILAGALLAVFHDLIHGTRVFGVGLVAMAVWLGRFDVARKTIAQQGLPRYVAFCLLSGYAWLAAGGAMLAIFGQLIVGPRYDAALHAVFVGFVLSMVFGHGPVILPALAPLSVRYSGRLYAGPLLLHGSLLVRVVGDLGLGSRAREIGGLINVLAIAVFVASMVSLTRRRSRPA